MDAICRRGCGTVGGCAVLWYSYCSLLVAGEERKKLDRVA